MNGPMGEESHGPNDDAHPAEVVPISISQSSPSRRMEPTKDQKSLSTPTEKKKTFNAFAMMMSGSKTNSGSKKRKLGSITGSKRNDPTTTTSKFVRCPVGCGKHILPHEMNKHLDACLQQQATKRKQEQETIKRKEEELEKEKDFLESIDPPESRNERLDQSEPSSVSTESTPVEETQPEAISVTSISPKDEIAKDPDQVNLVQDNEPEQQQDSPTSVASKTAAMSGNDPKPNNAFAHMMKNSAKVFSEQEPFSASSAKLFERMHLHEDGRVSLTCFSANRMVPLDETIAWSATIQVRGKKEGGILPIDLLVTSAIPSSTSASAPNEPERTRLVRMHSRLSVPVLKSILQKGIRRRKPLPSVRVASEIADKSLGDLLRRLPIIILEDSTMHPEFPFLVWLMMAVSKDYQPPLSLLKKVLGVVFEMASCRWQDSLITYRKKPEEDEVLTLASLHKIATATSNSDHGEENATRQNQKDIVLNEDELIVWSILMRAQYGGMTGDIRMLQGYAEVWHKRFKSIQRIPNDVKKRLSPKSPLSGARKGFPSTAIGSSAVQNQTDRDHCLLQWNQVPGFIHELAAKHSASRIERLLMMAHPMDPPHHHERNPDHAFVGLSCLSKIDLTIEGVDFHCSSVLESAILRDTNLVKECFVKLANGPPRLRAAGQDRRSWLEGLLKSCMWKFSGGVNFRMPLLGTTNDAAGGDDNDSDLKDFYGTLIKPRVDAFSERYIDERINKR